MAMEGLTWLHLSDWHQKGEDFDRKVVRDALIKDIKERSKIHGNLETVDFIIFSGDVAFSGKQEEYKAADEHLFKPLLEATGLDENRLFIVPGNHDLDHGEFEFLPEDIKRRPLTQPDEIKKWLSEDKRRDHMLKPFEAYAKFVKHYAGGNLSPFGVCYEIPVGGKQVALLGFNSALMCGRREKEEDKINDYGNIIIGEPQIYDALRKSSKADVRIAVMHHPFDWLTEKDRITVESSLKKDAHFILYGHQHRGRVTNETGTEGDCTIIPAGAAYNRRVTDSPWHVNAYNFVHLDFKKRAGIVYLRHWDEDAPKAWTAHKKDSHPNGEFEFRLPKDLCPGEEPETNLSPPSEKNDQETEVCSSSTESYDLDNPVFNIQYRAKKEGMVGQENALQKVREQLMAGKRTAIGHTAAFQGLGGLGKTQLAVEYAHRFKDDYPRGVIWINADQDVDAQLILIAKQAKWVASESKHSDILDMARHRLKTRSECLIIFDNVEERETIEPYLPEAIASPHLLLTSRAPQKDFVPIEISVLDDELSFSLLRKESGRDFDSLSEAEQNAAREIASSLDGLPLAIEIAGAYLSHIPECSFKQYKTILEENFNEAMKGDLLSSFTKHERNLFLTLQVSQPVFRQAPLMKEISDLLAWSGSSFMGISLMAAILDKEESELYHPLAVGTSLRLLHKSSEGVRYEIHRLVRRVWQEQYPITNRQQWVINICQMLGDWFEERRIDFTHLAAFEAEIDHLKEWLIHIKPYSSTHVSRLIWLQAYPPYHWGKYQESHQLVQFALSLLEKTPDVDKRLKANILSDISVTYNGLADFSKALEYQKQALDIRMEILGFQHPDTADSIDGVGVIYRGLGNYKDALKYHKQALDIQKKNFGEFHPRTAAVMNHLGTTYNNLRDFKKAFKYHKQALDIQEKNFGELHPRTAGVLHNLGIACSGLGDHEEALRYQEKALDIHTKLFGEQHPDTAFSLHSVGASHRALGQDNKAIHYVEHALEIRIQILGAEHPDTASSLSGLVLCLAKLKKFKDASDKLTHYLKKLPPDHPKYNELEGLKAYIDKESLKSGFRPMSATSSKKKKRKKKKKR